MTAKPVKKISRRIGRTVQNSLEVARLGGLETGEKPAPFDVATQGRIFRLRHYFPSDDTPGRPVLLVPPLMLTADVYDVSPQTSAVRTLHELGVDAWLVDFGSPEHEPGGLERNLTDHVLAVNEAVDFVCNATGNDVHLAGYSQGGMFCYQTAAYRRSAGIASLITFGSPVDLRGAIPLGIPEDVAVKGVGLIADRVLKKTSVPGWATKAGFRMLDPVKSLQQRADFLMALHDREALLPREGQRRYLMSDGWVAWPGPALAEFLKQFLIHNRMLKGGFTVGDRSVSLADIDSPILTFVGESDDIAPPAAVRPIRQAAPRPEIYEVPLPAGHFGLVVGRTAMTKTWPVVADWMHWLDEEAPKPEAMTLVGEASDPEPPAAAERVDLVVSAGSAAIRSLANSTARSARNLGRLAKVTGTQSPRLRRIRRIDADTRLSMALLIDEQARHAPQNAFFLFEDHVVTYADAKKGIDAAVGELLASKVRIGEHVGVLMHTRPTALAVLAALNRIGAVAVLLRPGATLARELELGEVTRVVVDPDHADIDAGGRPVQELLLLRPWNDPEGGFLPPSDGSERLPDWYEPNPGRASDLAFILFGGDYDNPRLIRITNGRYALSAFGTATSGQITKTDTVYSINPIYHPSGLLTSIGGAVAGGARLAMASTLDPDTFWSEVRRYGVTIVSYSWAQLRDVVNADPHPNEISHPIRLFVGSGMPRSLWRRVVERFAPATVLDFWATSEGEAILANIDATKPGSLGRPLPGSAEVRVVRWDRSTGTIREGDDGYAIEADVDEIGLLLAKIGPATAISAPPLRNLFERGDRWFSSESLARRDGDGDYWLIDSLSTIIRTVSGVVFSLPITAAVGKIPAVDLALTYSMPAPEGADMAVTAVALVPDATLTAADLDGALGGLDIDQRPKLVGTVKEIPMTEWHRPIAGPLRDKPIPASTSKRPIFYLDEATGHYATFTRTIRSRWFP
ncbi:alpha/beta fold hydrolase [Antrihabitans sp. YC2-6]|uniref:alpha/beta fold hydrolase n=1 Tax=Antrihabitans sp. YC2-6 TaxID=2799498 RepID=UPI0018F78697|nr:alpha/beta fold hydrolase [Antrihabitans sp. YC2-6]MBJ8346280.1 alpha/beta fold hydrolase [Antrihabitans sp. YC2-6]